MNTTKVSYEGKVKLTFNVNGKVVERKVHNNGLPNLFRSLCATLAGYNADANRPQYIDVRMSDASNQTYSTIMREVVPLTNIVYENVSDTEQAEWTANFTAHISLSNLTIDSEDITDKYSDRNFRLYLCYIDSNTGVAEGLAWLTLGKDDLLYVTAGTTMLVNWSMGFVNA